MTCSTHFVHAPRKERENEEEACGGLRKSRFALPQRLCNSWRMRSLFRFWHAPETRQTYRTRVSK